MIIFCIGLLYVRNECDWTRRQYFLVISFSNTSSCAIDVQSSILIANLRDISSRCTGCIYAVCAALRQCNKSRYIADVYELGFVMVETALYLDTHPDDGEALAFYADMKHQYAEAVRLYNENVGPLSFYHVTNENYWNWVATPMPWEMEG